MRPVYLLASFLCAGVVVGAADTTPFTFPRSTPESQGVSSSGILAFIEEAEQKIDALHSVMVVRHGQVVAEGWWAPYAAGEPHMLYSLSKSFTSTAVGLAVAEGKLRVDDEVLRFFPEEAPPEPSANLRAMRVRDLLTMSTGHHEEAIRDFPYSADESVVKAFLARPVPHKPGTFFVYNTPASYMLSAIVQKVTGQTVLDYLRPRLFVPLGIANPTWEASRQGISMGGFGLSLRTEDIARFGQLYLRKGEWQGQTLVPAAWVEAATSRQMSNGSSPTSDWEQGYGYQFWRSRHGFYRGDGAHGQFCLVLPEYDTVIAITSGTRDMASVMNLVWDRLVPALKLAALPADAAAHKKLTAKLARLTLRPQAGPQPGQQTGQQPGQQPGHKILTAASSTMTTVAGKRYVFGPNPQAIEAIVLDAAGGSGTSGGVSNGGGGDGGGSNPNGGNGASTGSTIKSGSGDVSLVIRIAGMDQRIVATPGAWRKGTLVLQKTPEAIAASGAWTAADTYTLTTVRYQTPFATTWRLRFAGDQVTVDCEQNVGPADARTSQFVGKVTAPIAPGSRVR